MKLKKLKLLNLILAAFLLLYVVCYTYAWFATSITPNFNLEGVSTGGYFAGGNGTESAPYQIAEPQHLYNLSYLQNKGTFSSSNGTQYYFEMVDDVNMSEGNFVIAPIGNASYPFTGVFNGNGHVIYNLVVTTNKNLLPTIDPARVGTYAFSNSVGMFGKTSNISSTVMSDIKNFILYNPVVEVAETGSTKIATKYDSDAKYAGLAVGYVSAKASSIGVYGGKLAVNRSGYSTVNSIIGYADEASVDITGGSGDTGIFYPAEGTLKSLINANATSSENNNGLWLLSSTNGSMGNFSLTIKPTVNASQTQVYKDGNNTKKVDSSSISGITDETKANIQTAKGALLTSLSGYMLFSGGTGHYSYDSIIDETGKIMTGTYPAGSYTTIGNAIKFNITSSSAKVYIIAGSTSSQTRTIGLYKVTDLNNSGASVNYNNPALFYNSYACVGGHTQYMYSWETNDKSNGEASIGKTMMYYSSINNYVYDSSTKTGATHSYTASVCKHPSEIIKNGSIYKCVNCGKTFTESELIYTEECDVHEGGYRQYYRQTNRGDFLKTNVAFGYRSGDGKTVTSTQFGNSNVITINSMTDSEKSNFMYYLNENGNYVSSTTEGAIGYRPLKINTSGSATFTANYDGKVRLYFMTERTDSATPATSIGINSVNQYYQDSNVDMSANGIYEKYITIDVEANQSYTITRGDSESSLCAIEYVSSERYLAFNGCNLKEDNSTCSYKIDAAALSHNNSNNEVCYCNKALTGEGAKSREYVGSPVDTLTLPAKTTVYGEFSFEELGAGSYQIASTNSAVAIYYMRVNGMASGNSGQKNVSGIDFIYKDVYLKQSGDNFSLVYGEGASALVETGTRITFTTGNSASGVTLYFYRSDGGKAFYVGYFDSAPAGTAQKIALSENLTLIDNDGNYSYTYETWTP